MLAIDPVWHDFVRLWFVCRGEAGIQTWPDAGGVNDQAAWIVDAFAALSSHNVEFEKARGPNG